eukprot:SAG11_NODE_7843_length_1089_cov_12.921212_1_plen_198_part_00
MRLYHSIGCSCNHSSILNLIFFFGWTEYRASSFLWRCATSLFSYLSISSECLSLSVCLRVPCIWLSVSLSVSPVCLSVSISLSLALSHVLIVWRIRSRLRHMRAWRGDCARAAWRWSSSAAWWRRWRFVFESVQSLFSSRWRMPPKHGVVKVPAWRKGLKAGQNAEFEDHRLPPPPCTSDTGAYSQTTFIRSILNDR